MQKYSGYDYAEELLRRVKIIKVDQDADDELT